jgi:hypothetical protein
MGVPLAHRVRGMVRAAGRETTACLILRNNLKTKHDMIFFYIFAVGIIKQFKYRN